MENNRNQDQASQSGNQGQQGGNMGNQGRTDGEQQLTGTTTVGGLEAQGDQEDQQGMGDNTRRGNSSISEE